MFGIYLPKPVYDAKPYAYAFLAMIGYSTGNGIGEVAGCILMISSLKIMKMRD
jgi:hypothetical protein